MVVNKGFSFSNFVDQYELKTFCRGISEELKTEFSSIFTEDELYQHAEIVSICPANHLTEIYSTSSFNSDQSIAFEFSNIDIHDYSQVIAFCNKFGSIYSERLLRNNSEYEYIFMNRSKNEFAPAVATREFDTMLLFGILHVTNISLFMQIKRRY